MPVTSRSWNLRLFRRGLGCYEVLSHNSQHSGDNEVHEHVILNGPAGYLSAPMDHFAYPTVREFIEKHQRYAYWEAEMDESVSAFQIDGSKISGAVLARRTLKRLARRFPVRTGRVLLTTTLSNEGFWMV